VDWPGILLGLVGVASGVAGFITAKSSAKKSDVDALRGIIEALQNENTRLSKRVDELEAENVTLRKQLGLKADGRTSKGLALDR